MNKYFVEDQLQILADKARAGQISRRRFTQLATLFLGSSAIAIRGSAAFAQSDQLVLVNWGGDAVPAYDNSYAIPFAEATGITVKQDTSGPTEGAITAQVQSGKPAWDIVDTDPFSAEALGKKGMIEPIDYAIVDKSKIREGFAWEYSVAGYFYSYVIAYDATQFGDNPPTGMADFFDIEKYPGKRGMYKWGAGMWEALLLADGVAPADLYPLDLDRAHAKLAAFKDNVAAFWGGGAESQSLLLNGDASMVLIWSTRGRLLEEDSGGDIKQTWAQGLVAPGAFAVIKGNPGGAENAMKFIAFAQEPERQLGMFEALSHGPANPATDALIPDDLKKYNPVDPENFAQQIPLNMAWYEEHYSAALDAYLKVVSA